VEGKGMGRVHLERLVAEQISSCKAETLRPVEVGAKPGKITHWVAEKNP
jgi:hypothetical protein